MYDEVPGILASKRLSELKERSIVLLNEIKVKRNGKMAYVSVCLDLTRREVVSARSYSSASIISTADTVKRPRSLRGQAALHCGPHPVVRVSVQVTRGGVGAADLRDTQLHRKVVPDLQGQDETVLQQHRDPRRREGDQVERFVHRFTCWYNRMRPHETLKGEWLHPA